MNSLLSVGEMKLRLLSSVLFAYVPDGLDVAAEDGEFEGMVCPFFRQYCTARHDGPTAKAGIDLTEMRDTRARGENPEQWSRILEVLERSEMPPGRRISHKQPCGVRYPKALIIIFGRKRSPSEFGIT